jgi:hypothetical protein
MIPVTIEEADLIAKTRVDRRVKQYFSTNNLKPCPATNAVLFKNSRFTTSCSGCSDDSEYSCSDVGLGCKECGGTGKRVFNFPNPCYFA